MPLFEVWATVCAPAVALEVLVGIARVESGMRPLVVRDAGETVQVNESGLGVSVVIAAMDQGRETGIGLLGVTEKQARDAGFSISDAFEPCTNLKIAEAAFKGQRAAAEKRGTDTTLWDRVAVRSWWRPDGRFVSGAAYEAAVLGAGRVKDVSKTEVPGRLPVSGAVTKTVAAPPASVGDGDLGRGGQAWPGGGERVGPATRGPVAAKAEVPVQPWDVFGRARESGALIFQRRD